VAQSALKALTVLRSGEADRNSVSWVVFLEDFCSNMSRLTRRAGESESTVDVGLTALRGVESRAEVDGGALLEGRTLLDGGGGGEGCEGGEGEGGEMHFGGVGWLVGLEGSWVGLLFWGVVDGLVGRM
jgi:hypothetical protein